MAEPKSPSGPSNLVLVLVGFALATLLALWMLLSQPEAPHDDHGAGDGHATAASGRATPPPAASGSAAAPR